MTNKEQLWYLINGLLDESYRIETFCSEFWRIYTLELDLTTLTPLEHQEFSELVLMAGRFSDCEEDFRISSIFCTEAQIKAKAEEVKKKLG